MPSLCVHFKSEDEDQRRDREVPACDRTWVQGGTPGWGRLNRFP